jgi:GNAT superfamily N-acetyltransferase
MTTTGKAGRVAYEVVDAAAMAEALEELGEILADAVESGASMNFILPFSVDDGVAYWRSRLPDVASGAVRPIIARVDGRIEGVTLLVLSRNPNSPHRAEVAKVMVHRRARGHGLGSGLMTAVEALAWAEGRWLLILDTMTGSDADRMYRRLGWLEVGVIQDHSLAPNGILAPTTFFCKDLRSGDGPAAPD